MDHTPLSRRSTGEGWSRRKRLVDGGEGLLAGLIFRRRVRLLVVMTGRRRLKVGKGLLDGGRLWAEGLRADVIEVGSEVVVTRCVG